MLHRTIFGTSPQTVSYTHLYTGEVSAAMVASTGAKYVLLGHSERRAYYGATVAILEEKVKLALANGLRCV